MIKVNYSKETIPEEVLYLFFIPKFTNNVIEQEQLNWGKKMKKVVETLAPDLHKKFVEIIKPEIQKYL
jgi:hypothetical protein